MRFIRYPLLAIFCVFYGPEEVEVDKNAKKDEANIQISWLNKLCQQRIYHGQNENIFLTGPTRDIPREQEWLGLLVNNTEFALSCPLADSAIIIKFLTICTPFIGDNSWITVLIFSILLGLLAYIMTQIGLFLLLLLAITMSQAGKYFHCHAIKEKNQNRSIDIFQDLGNKMG